MRIFFTGNRGVIADDILPLFEAHEVVGFDKKDGCDVTDISHLYREMPFDLDLIFHLANIPHPIPGKPPDDYYLNNLQGTINLLRVAKEHRAKGIVFFSSLAALGFDAPLKGRVEDNWNDSEYPTGEPPYDEESELLPSNWLLEPYGVSKVFQESYIRNSKLPYLILRLGPYGEPQEGMDDYYNDAVSKQHVKPVVEKILTGIPLGNQIIHICRKGMWGGDKLANWLQS